MPNGWKRAGFAFLIVLLQACSSGSSSSSSTSPPASGGRGTTPPPNITVLFLGNSYSFSPTNELPQILMSLASAAGRSLIALVNAPGGNTLGAPQQTGSPHSQNIDSLTLIGSQSWDFVVLQEESTIPTIPFAMEAFMKPGSAVLNAVIKANNPATQVLFFQTWARDQGGQFTFQGTSPVFPDFDSMQDALTASYKSVASSNFAQIVPVGEAWRVSRELDPILALHAEDGSHPSPEGSYLAACVFYASIYKSSPVDIPFISTLQEESATFLQRAAAEAVWGDSCGLSNYGETTMPLNTLELSASGETGPGGSVSLTPGGLQPEDAGSLIFSSLSRALLPFPKGTLLIDLTEQLLKPRFVSNGESMEISIPPEPEFTGLEIYFQALAADSTQPGETLFSPGVRLQVCP